MVGFSSGFSAADALECSPPSPSEVSSVEGVDASVLGCVGGSVLGCVGGSVPGCVGGSVAGSVVDSVVDSVVGSVDGSVGSGWFSFRNFSACCRASSKRASSTVVRVLHRYENLLIACLLGILGIWKLLVAEDNLSGYM